MRDYSNNINIKNIRYHVSTKKIIVIKSMSIYAYMEKTIFGILDGKLNLYPQNRIIDAITNRKRKNTKSLKGILSDLNRSARNVLTHVKNVSMK